MLELFHQINWAIITPIIVIQWILIIIALRDLVKSDKTNGSKWLWLFIIVFISMLEPILYFVIGRRRH